MLSYYRWLAGLALLFIGLERIWPRVTGRRIFRPRWLSDVAYFVFNSKYLGILLGYITVRWVGPLDTVFGGRLLASWPWWAQFGALLISIRFPEVGDSQPAASGSVAMGVPQGASQHRRNGLDRRLAISLGRDSRL
jgi:hypothetical protein